MDIRQGIRWFTQSVTRFRQNFENIISNLKLTYPVVLITIQLVSNIGVVLKPG